MIQTSYSMADFSPVRRSRHRLDQFLSGLLSEANEKGITLIFDPTMIPLGSSNSLQAYIRSEAKTSLNFVLFGIFQADNSIEPLVTFPTEYKLLNFNYNGSTISAPGFLALSGGNVYTARANLRFDADLQLTIIEITDVNGDPIEIETSTPGYVFFKFAFELRIEGSNGGGGPCRP